MKIESRCTYDLLPITTQLNSNVHNSVFIAFWNYLCVPAVSVTRQTALLRARRKTN